MIDAVLLGFYTKLAAYKTLGKVYHLEAPQNTAYPYVTYGLLTDVPVSVFGSLPKREELTFWINCNAVSVSSAMDECDLVIACMDNASLTVAGYTDLICMREFIGSFIQDLDSKSGIVPLRYRVIVCKT